MKKSATSTRTDDLSDASATLITKKRQAQLLRSWDNQVTNALAANPAVNADTLVALVQDPLRASGAVNAILDRSTLSERVIRALVAKGQTQDHEFILDRLASRTDLPADVQLTLLTGSVRRWELLGMNVSIEVEVVHALDKVWSDRISHLKTRLDESKTHQSNRDGAADLVIYFTRELDSEETPYRRFRSLHHLSF